MSIPLSPLGIYTVSMVRMERVFSLVGNGGSGSFADPGWEGLPLFEDCLAVVEAFIHDA